MTPYYEQDGITIYHGDCLKILPCLVDVDTIIADPPYGLDMQKRKGGSRSKATVALNEYTIVGDDQPFDPHHLLDYRRVVIWGANHFAHLLPASRGWLVWDKREGGKSDNQADCEMAWTNMDAPARLFSHLWRGMIKASERNQRRVHPMQKPVALMRWCIQLARPAGPICDPYMGSGSTLVAAQSLDLPVIGIEIDERYCEAAVGRLQQPALGIG